MERARLTVTDIARLNVTAAKHQAERLVKTIDAMAYAAPEAGDVWQHRLNQAADLLNGIADALRILPPKDPTR